VADVPFGARRQGSRVAVQNPATAKREEDTEEERGHLSNRPATRGSAIFLRNLRKHIRGAMRTSGRFRNLSAGDEGCLEKSDGGHSREPAVESDDDQIGDAALFQGVSPTVGARRLRQKHKTRRPAAIAGNNLGVRQRATAFVIRL
jgi:hypothetical protein